MPARFLYWCGRSGRRYLFSRAGPNGTADFDEGVAIAANDDRIVWVGEVAALARMPAEAAPRRAAIYLHLLASTLDERRAVIDDLRPERQCRLRLAGRLSRPRAEDVARVDAAASAQS